MSRSSKDTVRTLMTLVLSLTLLLSVGLTTLADDENPVAGTTGSQEKTSGSLKIQPQYQGKDVAGGNFNVYHVASVVDGSVTRYELNDAFIDSNVKINEIKSAKDIEAAATTLREHVSKVDDEDIIKVVGGATATNLELGVYLIIQTSAPTDYSVSVPFLMFIPRMIDGVMTYDQIALPKMGYNPPTSEPTTPTTTSEPFDPPTRRTTEPTTGGTTPTIPTYITDPDVPETNVTDPSTIEDLTDPSIPQTVILPVTGMLQWPVPVLSTTGILLIGSGLFTGRNRKKHDEEE